MRILILDPIERNRESARLTLKKHDLMVVSNFKKAQAELLAEANAYHPQFEVVMADPVFDGDDTMPSGIKLALQALGLGVKYVALVPDTFEPNHVEFAALNCLHVLSHFGARFLYASWVEHVRLDEDGSLANKYEIRPGGMDFEGEARGHLIGGKNWASVLRALLSTKSV